MVKINNKIKTNHTTPMDFHDPWVGTDTPGYREAVSAGQDLEKQAPEEKVKISKFQQIKFLNFGACRSNFGPTGTSRRLYTQLFKRNPNLRPKNTKSETQGRKHMKKRN